MPTAKKNKIGFYQLNNQIYWITENQSCYCIYDPKIQYRGYSGLIALPSGAFWIGDRLKQSRISKLAKNMNAIYVQEINNELKRLKIHPDLLPDCDRLLGVTALTFEEAIRCLPSITDSMYSKISQIPYKIFLRRGFIHLGNWYQSDILLTHLARLTEASIYSDSHCNIWKSTNYVLPGMIL